MARIVTPHDITKLGTILGVWAHPDDESFTAGGIIATAVRNGQRVICVTATRGEAGVQDESRWPRATLGKVREAELTAALAVIGVTEHHWLGYADGGCATAAPQPALAKLTELIETCKPDTILTFGPDGLTGHPDHQAVSRWAETAARQAAAKTKPNIYHVVLTPELYEERLKPLDEQFDIFFNISQPPLVPAEECAIAFQLPPETLEAKRAALAAMPSQTERMLKALTREQFNQAYGCEYFVASSR